MAHRDTAPAAPARPGAVGMPQAEPRAAALFFDRNQTGSLISAVVAYGTAMTSNPPFLPRRAPSPKRQRSRRPNSADAQRQKRKFALSVGDVLNTSSPLPVPP